MELYLQTDALCRYYRHGSHEVKALDDVSVSVIRGEYLALVGASGSGKTTLLNLLAGLDTPTSGAVTLQGSSFAQMTRKGLSTYRARKVGMIFQSFNLISHYTALQNVEAALLFNGTPPLQRRRASAEMLESLGLADRMAHRPADLSGGEQQRVAVARAVVKRPEILFADEPTGNLDYDNSRSISALLQSLNAGGLTVVLVTHNQAMAQEHAHRTIRMMYGHVAGTDERPPPGGTA